MLKKRIFISSVQSEFSSEREKIANYIRQDAMLHDYFEPFLSEELPAQDQSAQVTGQVAGQVTGQVESLVIKIQ